MVNRVLLGVAWISVAAAIVGFVLPWATLDVKYRKVTDPLGQIVTDSPLQALAGKLSKKIGRVVVHVKRGAETVTGEFPDLSKIPTHVSGAEIPTLANRQDVHVVLALAQTLTGQRQLGAKSFFVYLLPGLALLSGIGLTLARRRRFVCCVIGLVCLAVAAGGFWKLLTIKAETLLVAITIGQGLWLSLWAYVGLGLASIVIGLIGRSRTSA